MSATEKRNVYVQDVFVLCFISIQNQSYIFTLGFSSTVRVSNNQFTYYPIDITKNQNKSSFMKDTCFAQRLRSMEGN